MTLATHDVTEARKRLLTRSSRYSGLLNVLDISAADTDDEAQLKGLLKDCNTWLAFNVTEGSLAHYTSAAIEAGVKRAIFTLELPPERFDETDIPSFDAAADAFRAAGGAFTGIRHGTVVPGSEDFAYQIVNATEPCVADSVRRGVLARVVAEMLRGNATHHAVCGLSSSGRLADAYLNVIRGRGHSRQEEVEKMFNGGVQKTMQILENSAQEDELAEVEAAEWVDDGEEGVSETPLLSYPPGLLFSLSWCAFFVQQMSQPIESDEDRLVRLSAYRVRDLRLPSNVTLFDDSEEEGEEGDVEDVDEQGNLDHERARALERSILEHAFLHKDPSWNVTREDFDSANRDNAFEVAKTEVFSWRQVKQRDKVHFLNAHCTLQYHVVNRKDFGQVTRVARSFEEMHTVADEDRLQLAQLLSVRHRAQTPRAQRLMADVWVRYIYLLLECTSSLCDTEGVHFEDLRPHEQTLLLRCQANVLRALCGLPASDVLCDPEDALRVVQRLTGDTELSAHHGLQATTSEMVSSMRAKFSTLLRTASVREQYLTSLNLFRIISYSSFFLTADPGTSGTNPQIVHKHSAPQSHAQYGQERSRIMTRRRR